MDRVWLREHFAELVLFVISLSLLSIKLGIGELESWDESLQVVRVLAIEKFDVWIDQSSYALGGFYSSTHPPLGIWLMAISREIFGTSELATRLPVAVAGLAAVFAMFVLIRRSGNDKIALLMAAAFGASTLFLWYSRHAQLESFVLAFALWSTVRYQRGLDRGTLSDFLLAGVLLGLALMSKFLWGLFVVPYLLAVTIKHSGSSKYWRMGMMLLVAMIVALPWHVYMAIVHPDFAQHVIDSLFGIGLSADHEPGGSRGGIYYLNQLIVNCPFIVAAICVAFDRKADRRSVLLPFVWLLVLLVTLQLVRTKMPHFAILLLPAAYLLSAKVIDAARSFKIAMWIVISITVVWSLSLQARLLLKGATFHYVFPEFLWIAIVTVLLLALLFVLRGRRSRLELIRLGLAGAFVLVSFVKIASYQEALFTDGARHISEKIEGMEGINEMTILHTSLRNDSLTARLAYYTNGWTAGWIGEKTSRKIAWDQPDAISMLSGLSAVGSAVVFERDWDRFNRRSETDLRSIDTITKFLNLRYTFRDSLRSYDLYYN